MKQLEACYLSLLIHCSLSAGFRNFGFYLGERGGEKLQVFQPSSDPICSDIWSHLDFYTFKIR